MDQGDQKQVFLEGIGGLYKDREYFITGNEFIIGRAPECDLKMKESTISARHAKIVRRGDEFEILDLGSTNGTFVNGIKVEKRKLRTADKISFDVHEFTFVNPLDVIRTEFSENDKTEALKETVMRSKQEVATVIIPEKTQPLPEKEIKKPYRSGKNGNLFIGLIASLLISYVISYGGLLLGVFIRGRISGAAVFDAFREQISIFPLMHLHTTWLNVDQWSTAVAISIFCLPLALFVGGIIIQDISRQKRIKSALVFSAAYVLLAGIAQLVTLNLSYAKWENISLGCGFGINQPTLNLLAVMAYFFGISLFFSFFGTLAGKK